MKRTLKFIIIILNIYWVNTLGTIVNQDSFNTDVCYDMLGIEDSFASHDNKKFCLQKCVWEMEGILQSDGVLNIEGRRFKNHYLQLFHGDSAKFYKFQKCLRHNPDNIIIKNCDDVNKVQTCFVSLADTTKTTFLIGQYYALRWSLS